MRDRILRRGVRKIQGDFRTIFRIPTEISHVKVVRKLTRFHKNFINQEGFREYT